jgi:perosamine synthetase
LFHEDDSSERNQKRDSSGNIPRRAGFAMTDVSAPAILGGVPVRPEGPPDWPPRDPEIAEALARCAADGSWGKYRGPHCERLAGMLAEYHGCGEVILCSSGTVAIELALRGLMVGPGDEVIFSAYDFKGNFLDVLAVGARPVLIDVESSACRIDLRRLETAIGPATKAILVSHLHGDTTDMPSVMRIAAARGIPVIEDACQCPGATVFGRKAGTWGDVGVLSFGGSKLLSAGRGGALFTNRADVAQRIRVHAFRGNDAYPLSELQACVLAPQLAKLDERNDRRASRVELLRGLLAMRTGLALLDGIAADCRPGFYKTAFFYDAAAFDGLTRDEFVAAMRVEGLAMDAAFRALHAIHSRARFRAAGELENASQVDRSLVVLHHPILLEEERELRQVVEALDKIQRHATMIKESAILSRRGDEV